jgi:hypothetical protein
MLGGAAVGMDKYTKLVGVKLALKPSPMTASQSLTPY